MVEGIARCTAGSKEDAEIIDDMLRDILCWGDRLGDPGQDYPNASWHELAGLPLAQVVSEDELLRFQKMVGQ